MSQLRPSNMLVSKSGGNAFFLHALTKNRLEALGGSGVQLGIAIEEWQRNGVCSISEWEEN